MGLRMKILSGFMILTVMLAVAGVWSVYELRTVGSAVQALLDDNYRSINASRVMIEALERQDSGILLLLSGKWEQGRAIMRTAHDEFTKGFKAAMGNVTLPDETAILEEIETKYREYRNLWLRPIVGTVREGNLTWYFQTVHEAFLAAKSSVERLMALNDKAMYQTASELKGRAHRAVMPGIVAILSALVFTLIFNYLVNYYLVSPIIRIREGIEKFVKDRRPFDVTVETTDELSYLVSSIRDLIAQLAHAEAR